MACESGRGGRTALSWLVSATGAHRRLTPLRRFHENPMGTPSGITKDAPGIEDEPEGLFPPGQLSRDKVLLAIEFDLLYKAAEDSPKLMLMVVYYTGLRRGRFAPFNETWSTSSLASFG